MTTACTVDEKEGNHEADHLKVNEC